MQEDRKSSSSAPLREAGFAEARYNREIYRRNMILAVLAIVLIAAGGCCCSGLTGGICGRK